MGEASISQIYEAGRYYRVLGEFLFLSGIMKMALYVLVTSSLDILFSQIGTISTITVNVVAIAIIIYPLMRIAMITHNRIPIHSLVGLMILTLMVLVTVSLLQLPIVSKCWGDDPVRVFASLPDRQYNLYFIYSKILSYTYGVFYLLLSLTLLGIYIYSTYKGIPGFKAIFYLFGGYFLVALLQFIANLLFYSTSINTEGERLFILNSYITPLLNVSMIILPILSLVIFARIGTNMCRVEIIGDDVMYPSGHLSV